MNSQIFTETSSDSHTLPSEKKRDSHQPIYDSSKNNKQQYRKNSSKSL